LCHEFGRILKLPLNFRGRVAHTCSLALDLQRNTIELRLVNRTPVWTIGAALVLAVG
jgi:hypothetical protein